MTGGAGNNGFDRLKAQLLELVASCTSVEDRRIGYGNLRCECSDWNRADERVTNIALIYETPGGSTCQINVAYDHDTDQFSFLGEDLTGLVITHEAQEVFGMVGSHVQSIPQRRLVCLRAQIDRWMAEGKTRSQLFAELNKLLQTEFLGGRISTHELRQGITYALSRYSATN